MRKKQLEKATEKRAKGYTYDEVSEEFERASDKQICYCTKNRRLIFPFGYINIDDLSLKLVLEDEFKVKIQEQLKGE